MLEWSIRVAVQAAASFVELFPQLSDLLAQAAICPLAMNPLSIMLRSSEDAVDWLHWPLDDQHVSQAHQHPILLNCFPKRANGLRGTSLLLCRLRQVSIFFSDGDTLITGE